LNLAKKIFNCLGWSLEIKIPDCPKCVICVAPHTSNWDFFYAQLACKMLKWKAGFLMKETWFFFPLNYLFKAMGGIPVPRNKNGSDLTNAIIDMFNNSKSLKLAITPEGTRKRVENWRTGIIRIAHGANIPIIMAYIDYKKKHIGITEIFQPSGDIDIDMKHIKSFYDGVNAKYPQKFCNI
jgi:1-acyl-sn-glycerol-3-phosphate acyltransferase